MTPVQLVEEATLGRGWLELTARILEAGSSPRSTRCAS
jgi:hypothetical protein